MQDLSDVLVLFKVSECRALLNVGIWGEGVGLKNPTPATNMRLMVPVKRQFINDFKKPN